MKVSIFFDLLILLGTVPTTIVGFFLLRDRLNKNLWAGKNKNKSLIIAVVLLLGAITIIYGSFIEPQIVFTKKVEIDIAAELKTPIKVAVFSDIQVGPYKREKFLEKIVEKVDKLNPDFILIPGDFVQNNGTQIEKEEKFLAPLEQLAKKYKVFAVNGNHEHGLGGLYGDIRTGTVEQQTMEVIRKLGVNLLDNMQTNVQIGDQTLTLYGNDDAWANQEDFTEFKPTKYPTILMTHNPDGLFHFQEYLDKKNIDQTVVDLVVSGHTHGGQIYLPFIGPIARPGTVLTRKYFDGLSVWNNLPLYVTTGLGESGPRARLFIPPEIVLLTIH